MTIIIALYCRRGDQEKKKDIDVERDDRRDRKTMFDESMGRSIDGCHSACFFRASAGDEQTRRVESGECTNRFNQGSQRERAV